MFKVRRFHFDANRNCAFVHIFSISFGFCFVCMAFSVQAITIGAKISRPVHVDVQCAWMLVPLFHYAWAVSQHFTLTSVRQRMHSIHADTWQQKKRSSTCISIQSTKCYTNHKCIFFLIVFNFFRLQILG